VATQFDSLGEAHSRFIAEQHIFFVATAAEDGRVNLSPKGMDSLRVVSPTRLIWRNLTGSGNETAGHLRRVNRITVMWCSFGPQPLILRVYGTAATIGPGDAEWDDLNGRFPADPGARQVFDVTIGMVQSSCGYAVPMMDFRAERTILAGWSEGKGPEGIADYWRDRNHSTIDGFPTGTGGGA
jgi:hypothetical protein